MPPPLVSHDPAQPALRFFYGLVPDAEAARVLARAGAALARRCGGRSLEAADLHLTLAFVGNRAPADRALLLPPALPMPAQWLMRPHWPAMRLDRVGSFGHGIVWTGPARTPAWLAGLARALRASLQAAHIGFDEKPMRAHITLVRGAQRWDPSQYRADFQTVPVSSWRLALGWSQPMRDGPRYCWQVLSAKGTMHALRDPGDNGFP